MRLSQGPAVVGLNPYFGFLCATELSGDSEATLAAQGVNKLKETTGRQDARYWHYAQGTHRSPDQYRRGGAQTHIDSCVLHYKHRSLPELLMLQESNLLKNDEQSGWVLTPLIYFSFLAV